MNFEKLLGKQVFKKHNAIYFSPILHRNVHIGPSNAAVLFIPSFEVLSMGLFSCFTTGDPGSVIVP